jgi:8-oxo-dGTP pyrophosphatase MutT (NUDIX family)
VDDPIPRRAARILLLDGSDRVLLFRGTDPGRPGIWYWFTAGGGLSEGESPAEGAARELREETGLAVSPDRLGAPVWRQVTDFPFDGRWYRQEQEFYLLRVDSWQVDLTGLDEDELRSIDGYHWWSVAELETTRDRFYPDELVGLLRGILEA